MAGEANFEAALTVAKGIVAVLAEVAPTPSESVAAAPGLSHVIRLQLQVASVTVTERVYTMPG
jgi:hypothetical protein